MCMSLGDDAKERKRFRCDTARGMGESEQLRHMRSSPQHRQTSHPIRHKKEILEYHERHAAKASHLHAVSQLQESFNCVARSKIPLTYVTSPNSFHFSSWLCFLCHHIIHSFYVALFCLLLLPPIRTQH